MADHSAEIAELTARAKVLQAKYNERYDDLKPLDAHRRELSLEMATAKAGAAEADKEVRASLQRAMEEDKFAQDLEKQARAAEVKGDDFEAAQIRQQVDQVRNDAERYQHDAQEARENADEYRAKVTQLTEQHEAANDAYMDLYTGLDAANSGVNRLEYVANYLGEYDKHTNAAENYTRLAAEAREKGNVKEAKALEASAAKETAAAEKAEKQVDVQRSYFDEAEKAFEILEPPAVASATPTPTAQDASAGSDHEADSFLEDEASVLASTTGESGDRSDDAGAVAGADAPAAVLDDDVIRLVDDAAMVAAASPTDGLSLSDDTGVSSDDGGSFDDGGAFGDVADIADATLADVDATPLQMDLAAVDGGSGDSFESESFAGSDDGMDDLNAASLPGSADTFEA